MIKINYSNKKEVPITDISMYIVSFDSIS